MVHLPHPGAVHAAVVCVLVVTFPSTPPSLTINDSHLVHSEGQLELGNQGSLKEEAHSHDAMLTLNPH